MIARWFATKTACVMLMASALIVAVSFNSSIFMRWP